MLPWYAAFKAAIFGLLACNAAVFSVAGTFGEALDTAAWLVLLVLFELETGHAGRIRGKHAVAAVARLAAAAAIGVAAITYVYGQAWLDALNSGLWILVVALLELEVRYPLAVKRRRAWFVAAATALYASLAAPVLMWAWRREWFEAYDALLWITAFATIELNVLQFFRSKDSGNARAATSG